MRISPLFLLFPFLAFAQNTPLNMKSVLETTRIIRAFSLKESGYKLILANETLSYKTLFKKIIEQNKQHTLLIPIPDLLLYALGFLGDILRFFKIKTNVSSTNLAVLRINNFYDNSKAMNELNMGFTPIEGAIQEAIFYFNGK